MRPSPGGGSGRGGGVPAEGASGWTPDEVFACVRVSACRVLEVSPERVTASTCLDELGADSLAVVEMAELMEEAVAQRSRHRVRVDDVALVRARTFADLAGELSRSLARVPGVGTPHPASAERARGM